jgi:hypothetical protein
MEKYGVDDSRVVDCGDKQYVGETQATVSLLESLSFSQGLLDY